MPRKKPLPPNPPDEDGFVSKMPRPSRTKGTMHTFPNGETRLVGITNSGGPGRPRNETRQAFAELVDRFGYIRTREMLEGVDVPVPVFNAAGKITGTRLERQFPKADTILRAVELSARLGRLLTPEEDVAPQDLPRFEIAEASTD